MERVIADSPRVIGGVDEVSALVLMGRQVYGIARVQVDIVADIAFDVVGITACGIGESLPCRAIGTVVFLLAGAEEKEDEE